MRILFIPHSAGTIAYDLQGTAWADRAMEPCGNGDIMLEPHERLPFAPYYDMVELTDII